MVRSPAAPRTSPGTATPPGRAGPLWRGLQCGRREPSPDALHRDGMPLAAERRLDPALVERGGATSAEKPVSRGQ